MPEFERSETVARLYLGGALYMYQVRQYCCTDYGNWHPGAIAYITDELRARCEEIVAGEVRGYIAVQHLIALAHEFFETHPDPEACGEIGDIIEQTFRHVTRRNDVQRMQRERPDLYRILEEAKERLKKNVKELLRPSA